MKKSSHLSIVLSILAAVVWTNPYHGQTVQAAYTRLAIKPPFKDPKSKTYKDAKILKGRVITGSTQFGDSLPADSALSAAGYNTVGDVFNAWYLGNRIPSMTHLEKLGELAQTRAELLDDLSRLPPGPARTALTKTILKYAWGFGGSGASSRFHPALRVNAMLLLGEINQAEASRTGAKRPPVPHAAARQKLLEAWKAPNQPAPLRVAILVGLERHVKLDRVQPANTKMSAEDRDAITSAMLTLLKQKKPQGNLNADGLGWMQRQAMEILADQQLQGAPLEQFTQLVADFLMNEENSLSLRCAAAATLGKVALPESQKPDKIIQALTQLAIDVTTADLAKVDRILNDPTSGMGGLSGGYRDAGYGGRGMERMEDGGREDYYMEDDMGGRDGGDGRDGYGGGRDGYGGGRRGEFDGGLFPGGEDGGGRFNRRPSRNRVVVPVVRVADDRTVPMRRQLLQRLISIRSALQGEDARGDQGLASATGANHGALNAIVKELENLITAAKDVTTDLEDFRLAVSTGNEKLAAMLGGGQPAEPAAAAAPEGRKPVTPEEAFSDVADFDDFE